MALNGLYCADVPLRNYSLTHSLTLKDIFESVDNQIITSFIKDAHFYYQL